MPSVKRDRGDAAAAGAAHESAPSASPGFDAEAIRARLASERGPRFWRSLEELADREGFERWMREEFPRLAGAMPLDRRDFLRFVAASLALGGLAGCGRPPQDEIVP